VVQNTGTGAMLRVSDDGTGGTDTGGRIGTGLLGLRERFAAAGGTIEASGQPGRGFTLVARMPVTETSEVEPAGDAAARCGTQPAQGDGARPAVERVA
jgi:signal transduction histidine kinase